MNLDVCEQAEQGSSPIRTAPGVSVVEALISLLGQPLMHVANHLTPDALFGELPARNLAIGSTYTAVPSSIQWCSRGTEGNVRCTISCVSIQSRLSSEGVLCSPTDMRISPPLCTPNVWPL